MDESGINIDSLRSATHPCPDRELKRATRVSHDRIIGAAATQSKHFSRILKATAAPSGSKRRGLPGPACNLLEQMF